MGKNGRGKDDPQKALGAVQDAPKGTSEQGNSSVEKGILRCGLPQAQCTAFGQDQDGRLRFRGDLLADDVVYHR